MDEVVNQSGELLISIGAAIFIIGTMMLLLGGTNAGVLREYLTYILEAAC